VVFSILLLIDTSPFGPDYIVKTLSALLNSPQFRAALENRFPALAGVNAFRVGDIQAVLRCLTPTPCPTLNCSAGEVEYQVRVFFCFFVLCFYV
jgi:hypothetical protein